MPFDSLPPRTFTSEASQNLPENGTRAGNVGSISEKTVVEFSTRYLSESPFGISSFETNKANLLDRVAQPRVPYFS